MNTNLSLVFGGLVLVAVALGGCGTTGGDSDGAQVDDLGSEYGGAQTSGASTRGAWTGNPLDDPDSLLYSKTVYFDFDQTEIREQYYAMLRAHADYLVNNRGVIVTVEGHADERGSREYNIGLGERRAQAVVRFLEAEGVSPSQLSTVSYGEERPEDSGHYESAWSANRRAVLNHQL